jgi:hypothetical protein
VASAAASSAGAQSRDLVLTRSLTAGLPALDPRAVEVSFTALRLEAADPQVIRGHADLVQCLRSFAAVLETGWLPGCSIVISDLTGDCAPCGGATLGASLLLGICGPEGTTADEALAFSEAARRLLQRRPAPYRLEAADPAGLLEVGFVHSAVIAQRSITVAGAGGEATAVFPHICARDDAGHGARSR